VKDTVRSRFQLQRASGQEPGYGPTWFLDAVPSPAAMRMRRSRERRREGLRCIRVELRETESAPSSASDFWREMRATIELLFLRHSMAF
jgi:hypothetical protein